ncbi:MAG: hypothetical protein CM1200mP10_15100 [Candidatus Neomarinimicrobiota bacterium]|nr:MAG: hypothetical protein CM1200mP10_15100 [Candidatus Neomarinimicrobiota bacterium]
MAKPLISAVSRAAQDHDALLVVDATQSAGPIPIDIRHVQWMR